MKGQLGAASSLVSLLVIPLYVNGLDVRALYRSPDMLWLICPILLTWARLWIIAARGGMAEGPVLYAVGPPGVLGREWPLA